VDGGSAAVRPAGLGIRSARRIEDIVDTSILFVLCVVNINYRQFETTNVNVMENSIAYSAIPLLLVPDAASPSSWLTMYDYPKPRL
jgi:hypothetical protein